MNGKLALRAGLASAVLALALPALAAPAAPAAPAKTRFKTIETWGWKAQVPDNMDQVGKERTDPKNPHLAKWVYYSDNKSVRLRITTRKVVKGKKFADIAKYNYLKFVQKKPKAQVLKMRQFKSGKRKVAYFIASVDQVRNKTVRKYIYLRLVIRAQRALAYIQLGVAQSRFDEFVDIAETLIDSFNLADPASVAKEVKRKGGKVAIVKDLPPVAATPKSAGKK